MLFIYGYPRIDTKVKTIVTIAASECSTITYNYYDELSKANFFKSDSERLYANTLLNAIYLFEATLLCGPYFNLMYYLRDAVLIECFIHNVMLYVFPLKFQCISLFHNPMSIHWKSAIEKDNSLALVGMIHRHVYMDSQTTWLMNNFISTKENIEYMWQESNDPCGKYSPKFDTYSLRDTPHLGAYNIHMKISGHSSCFAVHFKSQFNCNIEADNETYSLISYDFFSISPSVENYKITRKPEHGEIISLYYESDSDMQCSMRDMITISHIADGYQTSLTKPWRIEFKMSMQVVKVPIHHVKYDFWSKLEILLFRKPESYLKGCILKIDLNIQRVYQTSGNVLNYDNYFFPPMEALGNRLKFAPDFHNISEQNSGPLSWKDMASFCKEKGMTLPYYLDHSSETVLSQMFDKSKHLIIESMSFPAVFFLGLYQVEHRINKGQSQVCFQLFCVQYSE